MRLFARYHCIAWRKSALQCARVNSMSGRRSGHNASLIKRAGGLQLTSAQKLKDAGGAVGQGKLDFEARVPSARQSAAAAAAPVAVSKTPVEIAEAEAEAACAASKKAQGALFSAENSVKQLKMECRTALQHHKAACSLLESLRLGYLGAPPSDMDAG